MTTKIMQQKSTIKTIVIEEKLMLMLTHRINIGISSSERPRII